MIYGIKFIERVDGTKTRFDNMWLTSYNVNYHLPDGSYDGGIIEVCSNSIYAQKFNNVEEALSKWKEQPQCKCHSIRYDGKPNRPLTVYTIEVCPI